MAIERAAHPKVPPAVPIAELLFLRRRANQFKRFRPGRWLLDGSEALKIGAAKVSFRETFQWIELIHISGRKVYLPFFRKI
jgi:hypothetical protein